MGNRFTPFNAALTMLVKDDQVLMLRRANTGWADGEWTLPAGHIDEDESASTAAIRETLEEIGVGINTENLTFFHTSHRRNLVSNDTYVDFFFMATVWDGEPKNCEPAKCDGIDWFDINNLPDNTVEFVRNGLEAYKNGTYYSEIGWKQS